MMALSRNGMFNGWRPVNKVWEGRAALLSVVGLLFQRSLQPEIIVLCSHPSSSFRKRKLLGASYAGKDRN